MLCVLATNNSELLPFNENCPQLTGAILPWKACGNDTLHLGVTCSQWLTHIKGNLNTFYLKLGTQCTMHIPGLCLGSGWDESSSETTSLPTCFSSPILLLLFPYMFLWKPSSINDWLKCHQFGLCFQEMWPNIPSPGKFPQLSISSLVYLTY